MKTFPLTGEIKHSTLHAVDDETQEDERVVAVVRLHIFHHPLAQFPKVAGFRELALVHETCPRSNGQSAPVYPLFGRTEGEAFGEPEPVSDGKDRGETKYTRDDDLCAATTSK